MSVILEDQDFYKRLNKEIKKLFLNSDRKYLLYNLEHFMSEKVQERIANNIDIFNNWIDQEVNDLYNYNIESYNGRYKEDNNKEMIEDFQKLEAYNYKMSTRELLQLYQNLNFINYQIECKYDDRFLIFVQWAISKELVQKQVEDIRSRYETLEDQIKYGIDWGGWNDCK